MKLFPGLRGETRLVEPAGLSPSLHTKDSCMSLLTFVCLHSFLFFCILQPCNLHCWVQKMSTYMDPNCYEGLGQSCDGSSKMGGVRYIYMHVRVGGSEIALQPLFLKQTQSPLCWLSDLICPALWGFCTLQTTSVIDIAGFWRPVYNVSCQTLPLKPKKSHDNRPGTEAGLLLISIWHSVVPMWGHKKLIHVVTPMMIGQPLRQGRKGERQRCVMWGWLEWSWWDPWRKRLNQLPVP